MKNRVKIWAYAASTAMALCVSVGASAQSSDVVVMRKAIDGRLDGSLLPDSIKPVPTPPKPGEPGYFSWQVTAWAQTGSCGSRGTETRTVQCVRTDGVVGADTSCTGNGSGPKPVASRPATITQTCGYGWQTSDWSSPTPTCGTATRTRDVTCFRSDGTPTDAKNCSTSSRPDASENYSDTSTCSYGWSAGGWSTPSTQCGPATQTRGVSCVRSDGRIAAADLCDAASRPTTSQEIEIEVGCANHWTIGEWGSPAAACGDTFAYRSVTCVRSDGVPVTDDQCSVTKPIGREAATDYSTCTDGRSNDHPYGWATGSYGAPSTTCGSATSTRTVKCVSNAGAQVADAQCVTPKPEAERTTYETSGCSAQWATGEYGEAQPACGATVSVRSVYCLRSDGQSVSTSNCVGETRPASSQPTTNYSACSFGWTATSWSEWSATCGTATQTRDVACQRSDGSAAVDASCNAGSRPKTTQSSYQTSGCGVAWKAGEWDAALPACGTSSQTRSVVCMRSDGQEIDAGECSMLAKPPTTRDATDYSTCSHAWIVGTFEGPTTTCGTAMRTRSVQCQRSDSSIVDDAACSNAGDRPEATETTTQTSGCTFDWNASIWEASAPACGASTHSRTVTCRRSDGTAADPAQCVKTKPATSEATSDYSTCTYDWKVAQWNGGGGCGDTVTQTRSVTCVRSEGTTVGNPYCGTQVPASSQTITDYSACSYSWKVVNGLWSGTCSASATRTNSVTCIRQDGEEVDDSFCGAGKPETVNTGNYSSCTYTSGYGEYQTCLASAPGSTTGTQSAPISTCTRSDGTPVATNQCSSQSISRACAISYAATYSDTFGTCQATSAGSTSGTQTAPIATCTRSTDGASVPTSYCPTSTTSRSCSITYTGSYGTSYGACSPTTPGGTTGTQTTPIIDCRRSSDDAVVSNAYCTPQNKSQSCTVTYTPTYNAFGTCTSGSQTATIKSCTIPDGTVVSNSYCSPQTQTQTCASTIYSQCAALAPNGPNGGGTIVVAGSNIKSPEEAQAACNKYLIDNKISTSGVCYYVRNNSSNFYNDKAAWVPAATLRGGTYGDGVNYLASSCSK